MSHLKSGPLPTPAEMEAFVDEYNAGTKSHEQFVDFCETLEKFWLNELPPEEFDDLWKGGSAQMRDFLTGKYREAGLNL